MEKELSAIRWQLRKLNRIAKVLPLEMFYSVSFDENTIILHGRYSKEVVDIIKRYFDDIKIDANGYADMEKHGIRITLIF